MRFITRLILSILILAGGAAQSRAQTIFVNACAVAPGDGSQARPFSTMARAVAEAKPGSTLVVQGGSYPEQLTIPNNPKNLTVTVSGGPALIGRYFTGTQDVCIPVTKWEGDFSPDTLIANCAGSPPGVRARIYYPALAPGDAPVACGGPFPLIVYAHGKRIYTSCDGSPPKQIEQDYLQAEGLLTRLAASGIIVLSVDVSNKMGGFNELGKASIIVSALIYARDENARQGARLHRAVDLQRTGLLGHSTGGAGAIRAAACLSGNCVTSLTLPQVRIGAVGLLAPGYFNSSGDVKGMAAPVLVVHGTNETSEQVGDGPLRIYGLAASPKHLVVITGANHYGYTDGICIAPPYDNASEVGGLTGVDARRLQQQVAATYLDAFYSVYLRGDTGKLGYLLQQTGAQCGNPGASGCGSPAYRFDDFYGLSRSIGVCSCIS